VIDEVLGGLARLRARDAEPLSQDLSPENARVCLDAALDAITREGLETELATPGTRPQRVTLVCAYGVFTSPIEWTALLLAAGCAVHLKAPSRDATLCAALAADMAAMGLSITVSTDRDLRAPNAVIAMGDDATMDAVRDATPNAIHALYGHRFSVALVTGDAEAAAPLLARDAALYDGRGCMAPAAVFTSGDAHALAAALAAALAEIEATLPRGRFDPALGPEWRRRMGLARVLGTVHGGHAWAALVLPAAHFTPMALPRVLPVHAIDSVPALAAHLGPWRDHLSSCGTDDLDCAVPGFHRVAPLGTMQTPPFPRVHDGRPMLGSIVTTGG
jgi:hypothetical protein